MDPMLIMGTDGLDLQVMQKILDRANLKRLEEAQHLLDYLAKAVVHELARAMK